MAPNRSFASLMTVLLALIGTRVAGSQSADGANYTDIMTRIAGGMPATPGMFPWQVALKLNAVFVCGGSVISNNWILTSAHCVFGNPALNYIVTAGEHDLTMIDPGEQSIRVRQIVIHPGFDSTTSNNDFALLQLATPIQYNAFIGPIELASRSPAPGTICVASGWGMLQLNGPQANILQGVSLPIVAQGDCVTDHAPTAITQAMICAGGMMGAGTCDLDNGGPLVCLVGTQRKLVGVTSWATLCGASAIPDVFARVSSAYVWITSITSTGTSTGTKPGNCPNRSFCFRNNCATDNQCPGIQKCCGRANGSKCCTAIRLGRG